jgi:hypothetical protein
MICIIVFILELVFPYEQYFSFTPSLAFERPWTFITSIFLHADIAHLFFNMFALFMFGLYLEARVSKKEYLLLFFSAGFLGNIAYLLTSPSASRPAVGASGAIYGILGTLAILYPSLIVYVGYAPMPMIIAAIFWAILEFLGMFTPSNIAHQSHLAGLIVGVLYGFYLRKHKRKIYRIFTY